MSSSTANCCNQVVVSQLCREQWSSFCDTILIQCALHSPPSAVGNTLQLHCPRVNWLWCIRLWTIGLQILHSGSAGDSECSSSIARWKRNTQWACWQCYRYGPSKIRGICLIIKRITIFNIQFDCSPLTVVIIISSIPPWLPEPSDSPDHQKNIARITNAVQCRN